MKKTSFKTLILLALTFFGMLAIYLSFSTKDTVYEPDHTEQSLPDVSAPIEKNVWDLNHTEPLLANILSIYSGDLDGMLKSRVIRVLVIPSEIMFHVDKGKKTGFSYEYMKLFEKQINKHFPHKKKHFKTRVVFVPVSKSKLIPGLLQGRGDIAMADISITQKRKEKIDFSDPYVTNVNVIVVTGPSSPKINSVDDLVGKEVYVHRASSYYEYLEKMNNDLLKAGKEKIQIKTVPEHMEGKDVLEMINAGLIGITLMDKYKAKFWSKVLTDIKLHNDIVIKADDDFAWMIRKDSPQLMKEINKFIKTHKAGSLLGNILIRRYTDKFKFEKLTVNKKELQKFEKVVKLFQKYSLQYDLNPHLVLAQAYQESKLNQSVKSRSGAIGVMQLLPSTGKSMKVGNIRNLEPNIHAGTKYLRWLIDRYFENDEMDSFNQTLFAFAAYNAGPRRVIELRNTAKQRGYDPNIWFDNVEIIAAEKIGAETVTYISNIYDYYVAYRLYEEKKKKKQEQIKKNN